MCWCYNRFPLLCEILMGDSHSNLGESRVWWQSPGSWPAAGGASGRRLAVKGIRCAPTELSLLPETLRDVWLDGWDGDARGACVFGVVCVCVLCCVWCVYLYIKQLQRKNKNRGAG